MGAEIKGDEKKTLPKSEHIETPTLFGDPESYKHLTMEERKAMTERMKGNFQVGALSNWSQGKQDA
jgi:hypothetical protein